MKRMEIGMGGVKRKNEIEILVEIKEWENKKVREDKWKKEWTKIKENNWKLEWKKIILYIELK